MTRFGYWPSKSWQDRQRHCHPSLQSCHNCISHILFAWLRWSQYLVALFGISAVTFQFFFVFGTPWSERPSPGRVRQLQRHNKSAVLFFFVPKIHTIFWGTVQTHILTHSSHPIGVNHSFRTTRVWSARCLIYLIAVD